MKPPVTKPETDAKQPVEAPKNFKEDKRVTARHEHTNHFTNRADSKGS